MHSVNLMSTALVALSLAVSVSHAQPADPASFVRVLVHNNFFEDGSGNFDLYDVSTPVDLAGGFSNTGVSASGSAQMQANFGALKTSAFVQTVGSSPAMFAYSGFYDFLTIHSEGRQGQVGTITVNFDNSWSLATNASADAYSRSTVDIEAQLGSVIGALRDDQAFDCQTSEGTCQAYSLQQQLQIFNVATGESEMFPLASKFSLTHSFVFGEAFTIAMSLSGTVQSGAPHAHSASALIDAAHSAYWGGIARVLDQEGNEILFSAASHSGISYLESFATPVPEPTSAFMLLAGLTFLGTAISRRSRVTNSGS